MTEVHTILSLSPGSVEAMSLLLLTLVRRILVRLKQTSNNFCLFHSEGCGPLCFGSRSAILFHFIFFNFHLTQKKKNYIFLKQHHQRAEPGLAHTDNNENTLKNGVQKLHSGL